MDHHYEVKVEADVLLFYYFIGEAFRLARERSRDWMKIYLYTAERGLYIFLKVAAGWQGQARHLIEMQLPAQLSKNQRPG